MLHFFAESIVTFSATTAALFTNDDLSKNLLPQLLHPLALARAKDPPFHRLVAWSVLQKSIFVHQLNRKMLYFVNIVKRRDYFSSDK